VQPIKEDSKAHTSGWQGQREKGVPGYLLGSLRGAIDEELLLLRRFNLKVLNLVAHHCTRCKEILAIMRIATTEVDRVEVMRTLWFLNFLHSLLSHPQPNPPPSVPLYPLPV
jgi:hypothetical protein